MTQGPALLIVLLLSVLFIVIMTSRFRVHPFLDVSTAYKTYSTGTIILGVVTMFVIYLLSLLLYQPT